MLEFLDTVLVPSIILALMVMTASNLTLAVLLLRLHRPKPQESGAVSRPSLTQKLLAGATTKPTRKARIVVNSDEAVASRERREKEREERHWSP
jgi:hypothetical protein